MKPKLLQIAVEGNTGSTGTLAESIGCLALEQNWGSYIAHGRFSRSSQSIIIKIGNPIDQFIHGIETRLFDRHGLSSTLATKKLIVEIEKIQPDIIHLHHLHGYYINIKILFEYLKKRNKAVIWTFHDCWSFTGHCSYFDRIACNKWQHECNKCPQIREYPKSFFIDRSKQNFHLKKYLFTSLGDKLTIVSVSKWMDNLVGLSFLSEANRVIIHNGIDTNVFSPTELEEQNKIKERYKLNNKFIISGVASPWTARKGLADFIQLSKYLSEDDVIILVGLNKDEIKTLPKNIVGISKTENKKMLANIYALSNVFVNLTWEDNFPTTNIEALACGTPVITYNTGGSIEAICSKTGFIVEQGDIKNIHTKIKEIKSNGKDSFSHHCRSRVLLNFDKHHQNRKYLELYQDRL